jgi:Phage capsid protein
VADTFGSGASVGLTTNKLREMRRVAQHYENRLDAESLNLVAGSQQESDLLGQVEIIDKNFTTGMAMEDGRVSRVLGINMVYSERLQTSSSNTLRNTIGFVGSGMHLGVWKELDTRISQRDDLESDPWQLYCMIQVGAVRTQLGKVFQVNCADTTGYDITP